MGGSKEDAVKIIRQYLAAEWKMNYIFFFFFAPGACTYWDSQLGPPNVGGPVSPLQGFDSIFNDNIHFNTQPTVAQKLLNLILRELVFPTWWSGSFSQSWYSKEDAVKVIRQYLAAE